MSNGTPRTEAFAYREVNGIECGVARTHQAWAEFARTLERETIDLKAKLEQAMECLRETMHTIATIERTHDEIYTMDGQLERWRTAAGTGEGKS